MTIGAAGVVAGQMDLRDGGRRDRREIRVRIDAVVARVDVDVVDVHQQPATGARGDGGDEVALGDRGFGKREVAGHVLDEQLAAEMVLHGGHARADVDERLVRVRQRQQLVVVAAVDAAPAQVLGHRRGLHAVGQAFQLVEVDAIERVGGPERHSHAVQRQRVVGADAVECRERRAAVREIVLAVDLEPRDARALREHVPQVRRAEADAGRDGQCGRRAGARMQRPANTSASPRVNPSSRARACRRA